MRRLASIIAMLFFWDVGGQAMAQDACGAAPLVANETVRVSLSQKAKSATRLARTAAFVAELTATKTDIFSRYPEGARNTAYFEYIVCQLLVRDNSMNSTEKIGELNKVFGALVINRKSSYAEYWFFVLNHYPTGDEIVRSTLQNTGNGWIEVQKLQTLFKWREAPTNGDFVWLIDDIRHLELRFPTQGGLSSMRYTGD